MIEESVECEVWWASPTQSDPALLELLDGAERARHGRFQRAADRDRYAVAHALARLVLAEAAGCGPTEVSFTLDCPHCDGEKEREPHGKPRPAGPAAGLELSISHSGDRVAVALTRGAPVGVDVEEVSERRDVEGLAEMVLAPAERTALAALPAERAALAFHDYWARKEALLKASGEGIYGGLTGVSISPPGEPPRVLSWSTPGAPPLDRVRLQDLDAGPGYRAALAVLTSAPVAVTVHGASPLPAARPAGGAPPH
ncbi:4'-phosphopantetheinyl transferase family protein [Nocardiopsis sp. CNT-189]|uniref:4'-phosphopantetheinyl transferase family protein n=1 Tax=Nocardiopsis oceanisediminis TaxID=2816862 RepID=UPI003B3BE0E6